MLDTSLNRPSFESAQSDSMFLDFSGTRIEADKPVAVFSGNRCTGLPGWRECDHLIEQLLPVSRIGSRYLVVPFAGRVASDVVRAYAIDDNTRVYVDNVLVNELERGGYHEFYSDQAVVVTSNKKIQVYQFSSSRLTFEEEVGGPFMVGVPSESQWISRHIVTTPAKEFPLNYVSIVAPQTTLQTVTINGVVIEYQEWQGIPNTNFYFARVPVDIGTQTIAAVEPIGVSIYGYQVDGSYGYTGGLGFTALTDELSAEIIKIEHLVVAGSEQCISVQLSDTTGSSASQVSVSLAVTNSTTGIKTDFTGFSNVQGEAVFCWAEGGSGEDALVVTVDGETLATDKIVWGAYSGGENLPPIIESIPTVNAAIGTQYSYQPVVRDPNGDVLMFSVVSDPNNAGLVVDPTTGLVTWDIDQSVTRGDALLVELIVVDTAGNEVNQKWQIIPFLENLPPIVTVEPIATPAEGTIYQVVAMANDPNYVFKDRTLANDSFVWGYVDKAYQTDVIVPRGRAEAVVSLRAQALFPGLTAETNPYCYLPNSLSESLELVHQLADSNRRMVGIFGPLFDSDFNEIIDADDKTVLMAHGVFSGLYAIDAKTGEEVWSQPNAPITSIGTLVNIDNDVDNEYVHFEQNKLIAYNADGSMKWEGDDVGSFSAFPWKQVIPIDLENDGSLEFLFGPVVFDSKGKELWRFSTSSSLNAANFQKSEDVLPVDFDGDGISELAYYDQVRDANGSILWTINPNPDNINDQDQTIKRLTTTYFMSGNFDEDDQPEMVVSARYPNNGFGYKDRLILLDSDGTKIWDIPMNSVGPLVVVDFDGNGIDEIYFPSTHTLFNADGQSQWDFSELTNEYRQAASVADVDGNGVLDILRYSGELMLVHDSRTGEVIHKTLAEKNSNAPLSYARIPPQFLDIDNDGRGELITSGRGLNVYEIVNNEGASAANSQSYLNQHLLDTSPSLAWGDSNFAEFGVTALAKSDLVADELYGRLSDIALRSLMIDANNGSGWTVKLEVVNRGFAITPDGVIVALYKDEVDESNRIGEIVLTPLYAGFGTTIFSTTLSDIIDLGDRVIATVLPDPALTECYMDNNVVSAETTRIRVTDTGGLSAENAWSTGVYAQLGAVSASTSTGVKQIQVGELFEQQVFGIQTSLVDDIRFYLVGNKGRGVILNSYTGIFSWTPLKTDVGIHTFFILARSTNGRIASVAISMEVLPSNLPNASPQITSSPVITATIGDDYSYRVVAQDADGDPILFVLQSAPEGMTINSLSGLVQWQPDLITPLGIYSVVISVTDGAVEISQSFEIELADDSGGESDQLTPVNEPLTEAFVGENYRYITAGIDKNGETITISLVSGPPGMTINANTPSQGFYELNWLPDQANCQRDVILELMDSAGSTEQITFTIDVYNAPKRLNRFQCSVDAEFCATR